MEAKQAWEEVDPVLFAEGIAPEPAAQGQSKILLQTVLSCQVISVIWIYTFAPSISSVSPSSPCDLHSHDRRTSIASFCWVDQAQCVSLDAVLFLDSHCKSCTVCIMTLDMTSACKPGAAVLRGSRHDCQNAYTFLYTHFLSHTDLLKKAALPCRTKPIEQGRLCGRRRRSFVA